MNESKLHKQNENIKQMLINEIDDSPAVFSKDLDAQRRNTLRLASMSPLMKKLLKSHSPIKNELSQMPPQAFNSPNIVKCTGITLNKK